MPLLDRLRRLFADADAPTEADSERGGVLSYAGEYHALAIGAAAGFTAAVAGYPELAAAVAALAISGGSADWARKRLGGRGVTQEISREPWYAVGGLPIGYTVGVLATGAAGVVA